MLIIELSGIQDKLVLVVDLESFILYPLAARFVFSHNGSEILRLPN